ncbi:acyl-CoA dehydrogenase [Xanthomonas sp. 60]
MLDTLQSPGLPELARRYMAQTPDLPHPGTGQTLQRWQALAALGARDLALAKVLEAHYDARAILVDLGQPLPAAETLLAVWAAETPDCVLSADACGTLDGSKAWCSGASLVDAALVTVREGPQPGLYLLPRSQAVTLDEDEWPAPGMSLIPSTTIRVTAAVATRLGSAEAYLGRPGFWHGGAGIAAVWLGAAGALVAAMQAKAEGEVRARLAGEAVMALAAATALLRELAVRIDTDPSQSHRAQVVLVRSVAERACTRILDLAGRALGPGPMCLEPAHARRWADLTVFIRQSHADRDWAWLGAETQALESSWRL